MNRIVSVTETSWEGDSSWLGYDGFIIKTEEEEIKIGISNDQSCCEEWGMLSSDDDPDDFIGAEILDIRETDMSMISGIPDSLDAGGTVFIDIVTDRGIFQIAAYNAHNGYYGHEVVVNSVKLNMNEYI